MKCPHCTYNESRVLESRPTDEGAAIRRRRECFNCGDRFTTYERIETVPLMVIKKDGTREEFNRHKVLRGMITACEKRSVPIAKLQDAVLTIEKRLRNGPDQEVSSHHIGELVMEQLRHIDQVAYVRFASVYRQFRDIQRFLDELQSLLTEETPD